MRKGVSPILAVVLVTLVIIALSGAFLVYTQRTGAQLTESGTAQQQTLQERFDVRFVIEGVSNSQLFLRNSGTDNITYGTISIFLEDTLLNYTLPSTIAPNTVGTVYLNDTWRTGLGEKTLRVSSAAARDSVRVVVERPSGAVLDLRFDEASGSTAFDQSGSGNNGAVDGSATWIDGVNGNGLYRNGSAALATVSNSPSINFTTNDSFVMSIWFYIADEPSGDNNNSRIFAKGSTGNDFGVDITTPQTNPRLRFGVRATNGSSSITTTSTTLTYGTWHHTVFVHTNTGANTGNYKGYLDGTRLVNVDHVIDFGGTSVAYVMGGSGTLSGNAQIFRGRIDEAVIYGSPYSPDELYVVRSA